MLPAMLERMYRHRDLFRLALAPTARGSDRRPAVKKVGFAAALITITPQGLHQHANASGGKGRATDDIQFPVYVFATKLRHPLDKGGPDKNRYRLSDHSQTDGLH